MSDETHSIAQIELLRRLPGSPAIVPRNSFIRADLPQKVYRYAESMAMGRKLTVMASIPVSGPTLYADSDILFFPAARVFAESQSEWLVTPEPRYLLDCYPSFDDRLLVHAGEKGDPVNAGFLLLKQALNWAEPFERFEGISGEPLFFSEQTMVHLAIRGAGGLPFPPDRFVMRNEDQWEYRDRFVRPNTVMRHYISSFRHKMWLRVKS